MRDCFVSMLTQTITFALYMCVHVGVPYHPPSTLIAAGVMMLMPK